MGKLKFIEKQIDGRFEYHLPIQRQGFLDYTIFDNSTFYLDEKIREDLFVFIANNNISSSIGWDEHSILYNIALQALAKQKKCFLIYFNHPNVISGIQQNTDVVRTEWWNSIQFIQGDLLCQSFGMQTPELFLESVNYYNKDLSDRYFYMCEIAHENINRYTKIYTNDVANWFFIFTDEENEADITSILTDKQEKPSLDMILKLSSSVVNIQIGGDEGYLDYLLIQSKSDIRNLIIDIEKKQHTFIKEYEELLRDCKPFDDEWKVDFYKERMLDLIKSDN